MKKTVVFTFLLMLSAFVMAQKNVALLETLNGDKRVEVEGIEMNMVRGELRKAITNQHGYKAFTRTDIDQLMKEHGFQNSGMVSDAQRKRLGEMSGADYICVSTLTKSNTQFYLEAYLIDVETGEISNPATQYGILKDGTYTNLFQLCQNLAQELIGYIGMDGGGGYNQSNPENGVNYTETAFGINMKMIYVEGGSFNMGCTGEQGDECYDDEKNVRKVMLDGYYIGMLEVTQSQWFNVMKNEQSFGKDNRDMYSRYELLKELWVDVHIYGEDEYDDWGKPGDTVISYGPMWFGQKLSRVGADYPMYLVDYDDAERFCEKLSEATGKQYVLPTEAQWEYAARGGNKPDRTKYSGSNRIDEVAWYGGNSGNSVHICGTRRPNSLGIYDMSGNVSEWCSDYYIESYLNYDTYNPKGPTEADDCELGCMQVTRGGNWMDADVKHCRVSSRGWCRAAYFSESMGFRVVCIP